MAILLDIQRRDAAGAIDLHVYDDSNGKELAKMGNISEVAVKVNETATLRFESHFRNFVGATYVNIEDLLESDSESANLVDRRLRLSVDVPMDLRLNQGPRVSNLDRGGFYEGKTNIEDLTNCFGCVNIG